MSGKELNRRAVENLIRAGAFDGMGYKRKALLQIAGAVIDSISQAARDNIAGQYDLFGDFEAQSRRRRRRYRYRTSRNSARATR